MKQKAEKKTKGKMISAKEFDAYKKADKKEDMKMIKRAMKSKRK